MGRKFFKTIIKVYEIESAMNFAKKLFKNIKPPFIVVADIQKKGRGQYKKEWESPYGGLWFTEVLEINTPLGLSTYISIPIMRILKKYVQDVKIKWPNDILVENKKIAGILIEIKGNIAFIGIGINVENEIPDELKEIAISLKEKVCLSKNSIFNEIIKEQENLNNIFFEKGFKYFREEYKKNLILMNKETSIKMEKIIKGTVKDVTENGELILETSNGKIIISYGTVISYK
jgi:BirA family biotin operon repressor/biotin-[acetyl-CoA-carboxylase] ligase